MKNILLTTSSLCLVVVIAFTLHVQGTQPDKQHSTTEVSIATPNISEFYLHEGFIWYCGEPQKDISTKLFHGDHQHSLGFGFNMFGVWSYADASQDRNIEFSTLQNASCAEVCGDKKVLLPTCLPKGKFMKYVSEVISAHYLDLIDLYNENKTMLENLNTKTLQLNCKTTDNQIRRLESERRSTEILLIDVDSMDKCQEYSSRRHIHHTLDGWFEHYKTNDNCEIDEDLFASLSCEDKVSFLRGEELNDIAGNSLGTFTGIDCLSPEGGWDSYYDSLINAMEKQKHELGCK